MMLSVICEWMETINKTKEAIDFPDGTWFAPRLQSFVLEEKIQKHHHHS